ncbi:unnamed protein product [Darwinula stevensoni]|uniref:Uncharacterized protein n=1 Tax=Darwinula stevensoni TaxID=69355 RepID=A0A7R8XEP7_9CRUS|nr:unnamed protein product [Darwinula stevensoni]CAG0890860.1 unnamed protein product [Darwinula stevensoni]
MSAIINLEAPKDSAKGSIRGFGFISRGDCDFQKELQKSGFPTKHANVAAGKLEFHAKVVVVTLLLLYLCMLPELAYLFEAFYLGEPCYRTFQHDTSITSPYHPDSENIPQPLEHRVSRNMDGGSHVEDLLHKPIRWSSTVAVDEHHEVDTSDGLHNTTRLDCDKSEPREEKNATFSIMDLVSSGCQNKSEDIETGGDADISSLPTDDKENLINSDHLSVGMEISHMPSPNTTYGHDEEQSLGKCLDVGPAVNADDMDISTLPTDDKQNLTNPNHLSLGMEISQMPSPNVTNVNDQQNHRDILGARPTVNVDDMDVSCISVHVAPETHGVHAIAMDSNRITSNGESPRNNEDLAVDDGMDLTKIEMHNVLDVVESCHRISEDHSQTTQQNLAACPDFSLEMSMSPGQFTQHKLGKGPVNMEVSVLEGEGEKSPTVIKQTSGNYTELRGKNLKAPVKPFKEVCQHQSPVLETSSLESHLDQTKVKPHSINVGPVLVESSQKMLKDSPKVTQGNLSNSPDFSLEMSMSPGQCTQHSLERSSVSMELSLNEGQEKKSPTLTKQTSFNNTGIGGQHLEAPLKFSKDMHGLQSPEAQSPSPVVHLNLEKPESCCTIEAEPVLVESSIKISDHTQTSEPNLEPNSPDPSAEMSLSPGQCSQHILEKSSASMELSLNEGEEGKSPGVIKPASGNYNRLKNRSLVVQVDSLKDLLEHESSEIHSCKLSNKSKPTQDKSNLYVEEEYLTKEKTINLDGSSKAEKGANRSTHECEKLEETGCSIKASFMDEYEDILPLDKLGPSSNKYDWLQESDEEDDIMKCRMKRTSPCIENDIPQKKRREDTASWCEVETVFLNSRESCPSKSMPLESHLDESLQISDLLRKGQRCKDIAADLSDVTACGTDIFQPSVSHLTSDEDSEQSKEEQGDNTQEESYDGHSADDGSHASDYLTEESRSVTVLLGEKSRTSSISTKDDLMYRKNVHSNESRLEVEHATKSSINMKLIAGEDVESGSSSQASKEEIADSFMESQLDSQESNSAVNGESSPNPPVSTAEVQRAERHSETLIMLGESFEVEKCLLPPPSEGTEQQQEAKSIFETLPKCSQKGVGFWYFKKQDDEEATFILCDLTIQASVLLGEKLPVEDGIQHWAVKDIRFTYIGSLVTSGQRLHQLVCLETAPTKHSANWVEQNVPTTHKITHFMSHLEEYTQICCDLIKQIVWVHHRHGMTRFNGSDGYITEHESFWLNLELQVNFHLHFPFPSKGCTPEVAVIKGPITAAEIEQVIADVPKEGFYMLEVDRAIYKYMRQKVDDKIEAIRTGALKMEDAFSTSLC